MADDKPKAISFRNKDDYDPNFLSDKRVGFFML